MMGNKAPIITILAINSNLKVIPRGFSFRLLFFNSYIKNVNIFPMFHTCTFCLIYFSLLQFAANSV